MTITDDLERSWVDELNYGKQSEEEVTRIINAAIAAKLNINARDACFGETALHFVAERGYVKAAKLLLDNNADVNAVSEDSGSTPLHNAAFGSYSFCPEMVELLINHNADINAQDDDNNTPLHLAARGDRLEAAEILISRGAKVNILNKENKTALDLAIEHGSSAKMIRLIARAEMTAPVRIGHYSLTAKAMDPNVIISLGMDRERE